MQFTHIKIVNKGVELSYIEVKPAGPADVKLPPSRNQPLPEFRAALAAFKPFVFDLLGLPENWNDDVTIKGISIKPPDENRLRGLNVTWSRRIEKANGKEMLSNTPYLPERGENTSDNIVTLDDDTIALIETAELEAERYLNGEHAGQQDLFKGDKLAHAEEQAAVAKAKKAEKSNGKRTRKPKDFIPGVGQISNPEATRPTTDDVLRELLLLNARDVPIDAIARWSSTDRDQAQRWCETRGLIPPPAEPECVARDATPALVEG